MASALYDADITSTNMSSGVQVEADETDPEAMSLVDDVSTEYFTSYEDMNVHRLMLQDTVRTNAYRDAIENAASLFKNKIVMDVGAGTGILSLFCAKAGARKVYAVEASNLATVLPEVASKNGFSEIISVIHSRVEDVKELPGSAEWDGKVDIIVSEWMGFYLLHESMLDSVVHARDKFLRSGGLMFPDTAQIYAAPCSVPDLFKDYIEFWTSSQPQQSHYGFDLSAFSDLARNIPKPLVELVSAEGLLSDPQLLFDLNLGKLPKDSLEVFKDRRFFSIENTAEMHAVCLWFTCTFPTVPDKDSIELSTAPWTEATHWKQTVILLPNKVEFEEGDITGWEMTFQKALDKDSRSYTIQCQFLDANEEHPVPCSCGMVKCEIINHYMREGPGKSD